MAPDLLVRVPPAPVALSSTTIESGWRDDSSARAACESVIARSPNACAGPNARFVAHSMKAYLPRNMIAGLPTFTGDEHTVTVSEIGIRPCR